MEHNIGQSEMKSEQQFKVLLMFWHWNVWLISAWWLQHRAYLHGSFGEQIVTGLPALAVEYLVLGLIHWDTSVIIAQI